MKVTIYHASDKIWREGDIVDCIGVYSVVRVSKIISRTEGDPNTVTVAECELFTTRDMRRE